MTRILSRNNRYLLAIGGLAVLAVLTVALAYALTEADRVEIEADAAAIDLMHDTADELYNAITDQEAAIRTYLLTAAPEAWQAHNAAVAQEDEIAEDFRLAASEVPAVQAEIDALVAFSSNWQETFANPAMAAVNTGDEAEIERFSRLAAAAHEANDAARAPLGEQLDIADSEIGLRGEDLANSRLSATAFGLGAMLLAAASALFLIRRYGNALERDALRAGVINSFTEVASFASDDKEIAASNLTALTMLTKPDAAVTHILNRSKDRAVPEAVFGDPIAEVMTLGGLAHCAGLTRSSMYVSNDASAPLSLHCPVYSVDRGTLACIPLISGETVGVVHLYWQRPNALPFELRASVVRIAEHAALVIGNRRLLAALQGQANTDPRTGLANSRAFDRALEEALEFRTGEDVISVLMLDLDHFKDFNDRFGHPGGDEALRAFGGVLRSCMRDGDLAARYGGEEFAVFLPGVDGSAAAAIAERIRARTETTVISLAPGTTARITVSIGVSTAPNEASDRVSLLRIADEALYRSKEAGRNRVTAGRDTVLAVVRAVGVAPDAAPENRSALTPALDAGRAHRKNGNSKPVAPRSA